MRVLKLGKLITMNPPVELTKEEQERLEYIRTVVGKGYVRNYVVKQLHLCAKCGTHTWEGRTDARYWLRCSNCHYEITPEEWKKLDLQEYWEEI